MRKEVFKSNYLTNMGKTNMKVTITKLTNETHTPPSIDTKFHRTKIKFPQRPLSILKITIIFTAENEKYISLP
jgi:hypothetical protein